MQKLRNILDNNTQNPAKNTTTKNHYTNKTNRKSQTIPNQPTKPSNKKTNTTIRHTNQKLNTTHRLPGMPRKPIHMRMLEIKQTKLLLIKQLPETNKYNNLIIL